MVHWMVIYRLESNSGVAGRCLCAKVYHVALSFSHDHVSSLGSVRLLHRIGRSMFPAGTSSYERSWSHLNRLFEPVAP